MHVCGHGSGFTPVGLPDAGEGACCYGAAVDGPDGCTCWEPVFDRDQAPCVDQDRNLRTEMCPDCAYRPNSPERRGDPSYSGDEDDLMGIVERGEMFVCHQGIRKAVQWRHGPTGVTIPGHEGNYCPPIRSGVPFKADGTPADICAGWAALSLKRLDRGVS